MKVIMLQDVGGVGQRGKVVEVSDGYALNFLIPHKKAEQATAQKEADARKRMLAEESAKRKEMAADAAVAESLKGQTIKISARASEKGGLFKAIGPMDIAKAIMAQRGVMLKVAAIQIPSSIKTTGSHAVIACVGEKESAFTVSVTSS